MSELFGTKYFSFIASSYAATAIVLIAMVLWVVITHSKRKRDLLRLNKAGFTRASQSPGVPIK